MKTIKVSATEDRIKFLSYEIGENVVVKKGVIEIASSDPQDDFDLGYSLGREEHKEKPESFRMTTKYAKLLNEACREYEKETYIQVTSIKFNDLGDNVTEVIVSPTQYVHFMNICSRYGKMCMSHPVS